MPVTAEARLLILRLGDRGLARTISRSIELFVVDGILGSHPIRQRFRVCGDVGRGEPFIAAIHRHPWHDETVDRKHTAQNSGPFDFGREF